jgi:O-antigen ligase
LIALPVLVGTRSRADTLGLLAGVFVLLAFGRRWRWIAALLASGLVSLVLAPGLTTRFLAYLNRGPELPELAGRLAVWEHVLQHSLSSPKTALLGQGIGTSALVLRRAVERWAFPAHAHNLLLEALNNAGLPGVLLVLSSLVFVAHGAWAIARRVPAAPDGRAALLALFTLTLLVSAVEHTFAGRANVYAFGYWAVAASCHAGLSGPARSDSGGRAAHAS